MQGILGKKLGMTQIYIEDGTAIPVTVVKAGPCLVVQVKTPERDGYRGVQVGLVEDRAPRKVTKAARGHAEAAGGAPMRNLVELPLAEGDEAAPGDSVKCSIFGVDDYVDVTATSKGKGFQGVIKRHGFGGGKASHGSMFHRAPGSIGQSAFPSRVYPGTRLPGQTGNKRITVKNLKVVRVDEENDLLYLRGAVPGPRNGLLGIRRAKRG
jgi:large subunit ribosomal protein L3